MTSWRKHMIDISDIGIYLGLDVAKGEHYAHGLRPER